MNHAIIFYVSYFFRSNFGTMIPRVRVIWAHGTLHWMGLLSNDVLAHSNVSPDEFSYALPAADEDVSYCKSEQNYTAVQPLCQITLDTGYLELPNNLR